MNFSRLTKAELIFLLTSLTQENKDLCLKIEDLKARNTMLYTSNLKLNRRINEEHSKIQSERDILDYYNKIYIEDAEHSRKRLSRAYLELKLIFELVESRMFLSCGKGYHSVMDSDIQNGRSITDFTYANVFNHSGGVTSYNIYEELRRMCSSYDFYRQGYFKWRDAKLVKIVNLLSARLKRKLVNRIANVIKYFKL